MSERPHVHGWWDVLGITSPGVDGHVIRAGTLIRHVSLNTLGLLGTARLTGSAVGAIRRVCPSVC